MKRSAIHLFIFLLLAIVASYQMARTAASQDTPAVDSAIIGFLARSLMLDESRIVLGDPGEIARPVLVEGKTVAYAGSTWDIAKTAGYSARPIDVLVVVDTQAVIRGALLLRQEEPVLTLGIKPEQITRFVDGFAGYDLKQPLRKAESRPGVPDGIAGATISSSVIRSGIIRTARSIASHHGLLQPAGGGAINMAPGGALTWDALVAQGAVARLHVTAAESDDATGVKGTADAATTFIDLFTALLDPPAIGASLLGEAGYSALIGTMGGNDHALFLAANGLYSFKGTSWRRTGQFDRIELVQGERTIQLTRDQHRIIEKVKAGGAPELRETAAFIVPEESGFNPALPFRLSLIVTREDAAGASRSGRFHLDYALPVRYLLAPPPAPAQAETPLWKANWQARGLAIGTVVAMLLALYLILIFQNQIAARRRLYHTVRIGYLLTTVIVLGGFIGAQLSVVHVLTFAQALRTQFNWETFLLDPVIFIIWGWVAVALLFWGRVYCGWLCPFGALQELLNKLAQRFGVRQISVPFMLHERLWPIKYIIFLGLFAASLASMTLAFKGAEVEPFKTAITFRFMREWPFVLYAVGLLAAGLFIERFFCRYLCPLGAALAIPARLRMFEWLKRRPQCGRECRICSTKCPVQAIHPEGHINPNECVYCLNCQTLYHDEHICPPLKARAARRGAFAATQTQEPVQP